MKLLQALHQLRGLQRILLHEFQSLAERMARIELAEEGVAQTVDAGDDVVEIVREAGHEAEEDFRPGRGVEALLGQSQRSFVEPESLMNFRSALRCTDDPAELADVGDASRLGMAEAKMGADARAGFGRLSQVLLEQWRVLRVDALHQQAGIFEPGLGGMAGPLGDAFADELEAQVGRLPEEHAGPVLEENFNRGVHAATSGQYLFSHAKVSTTC